MVRRTVMNMVSKESRLLILQIHENRGKVGGGKDIDTILFYDQQCLLMCNLEIENQRETLGY